MAGSSNAQKTWFGDTQNRFATNKALNTIKLLGKSLPASVASVNGTIVTLNFEADAAPWTLDQVTCALATDPYARPPIQIGDKGYVVPCDVRLGGINGLGTGTAKLFAPLANLSAVVFHPIGNATWPASPDTNAYLLQGPNGFILRDMAASYSVVGNANGIISTFMGAVFSLTSTGAAMTFGGHSVEVKSDGVYIDGAKYLVHTHDGGSIGSGETGPVVP